MILIDTNVLLDVATRDPHWKSWSLDALRAASVGEPLAINAIVYAELSVRYTSVREVDDFLDLTGIEMQDIPRGAAFLAAKAFARYRTAGGMKTGVLSDFFIGAHAAALDIPILTRDIRRYRAYFPEVRLIAPNLN